MQNAPHNLDLVVFYADLGRPYLPLIENMTRSAKAVMPTCRTIIMTPTPSKALCRNFDLLVHTQIETTVQTVCYDKARAIVAWQGMSDRPCAFIDPDLVFKNPIQFPALVDVGLLRRSTKPAQPVNAGMILARPGQEEFWKKYSDVAANLPGTLRSWWCDQLAFSVMLGTMHYAGEMVSAYGANVKLIAEEDACAPPERAKDTTWALHLKGKRKGPGWESIYPSKSAAGTSSPASAS